MTKKRTKKGNSSRNIMFAIFVGLILVGFLITNSTDTDIAESRPLDADSCDVAELMWVDVKGNVDEEIVTYPGFTVSFNSEYKQPNWVAWELTGDESAASETRRENSKFQADESVKGCPTLADYKNSGFDRGHMCPAGDMKWSQEAMDACFYLTNICPQNHALNGGAWQKLEDKCRSWADRDSALIIICGPVLTDKLTRTIGPGKVAVPERFFKVILAPFATPMRGIGFVMPNTQVRGGIQAAAVSIDEIEDITGYDFFAALPDSIENFVEAENNFPKWNKK